MSSFNESNNALAGSSIRAKRLTAQDYFLDEDKGGYDTKENFLTQGKQLTLNDEEGHRRCIGFMKDGHKTDGGSEIRRDIKGNQYQYFQFFLPRSRPGAKVILDAGIIRLISDYQNGLITVDFTLDDLINEARKIK